MEPAAVASETLEGADRERLALFERFSAAAALAWNRGLYPATAAGQLASIGVASVSSVSPFAFSAAAPAPSPIPWIRKEKASRLRLGMVPWIILGPVYAIHVSHNVRVAAAALAVCGAASVVVAALGLRLRERLRAVPLSRVRSLAMGPVGLTGHVVSCASLKVPYSMTVCAWYRFELQEQRGDGSERNYRTILSGSSGDLPFRLEDETGRVLVQPADAEIDVEPSTMPLGLGQRLREWVLEEGESIYVAGVAQRRSSLEDEHRLLSERLSALKHDPAAMTRLGAVGDDAVEAWDRVRADVERQVLSELSARESEEDNVFIGSAPGQPFLIASRSRRDQTRRLTWQFAAGAALGIAYLLAALLLVTIV
jgi:hypothetical protein